MHLLTWLIEGIGRIEVCVLSSFAYDYFLELRSDDIYAVRQLTGPLRATIIVMLPLGKINLTSWTNTNF